MTVNKAILVGRLGQNPELRYTANQTPVCTLNVATNDRRKDPSGNWVDHTEWHRVVVFGKTAENCTAFLEKGREVYVEGRIQTRKWQDSKGVERYTTEIVASTVRFLGSKSQGVQTAALPEDVPLQTADTLSDSGAETKPASASDNSQEVTLQEEDVPF